MVKKMVVRGAPSIEPAPSMAQRVETSGAPFVNAFGIGPLRFSAADWPTAWTHFWALHAIPPEGSAASIDVVYVPVGADELEVPGALLTEAIRASGSDGLQWTIAMNRVFSAAFDVDARRLTIRAAADTAAQMALGNSLRVLTSALLPLQHDGLMVHASSGILQGQGIAFAGISTAGKSTMAEGFKDTSYLTDDVTLLGTISSAPRLLASPFYGALGRRGEVRSAPLRALCVLGDKVDTTRIERLLGAAAVSQVIRHVARFFPERTLTARLLDLVMMLVHTVPVLLVHRSLADKSDDLVRAVLRDVGSAP